MMEGNTACGLAPLLSAPDAIASAANTASAVGVLGVSRWHVFTYRGSNEYLDPSTPWDHRHYG